MQEVQMLNSSMAVQYLYGQFIFNVNQAKHYTQDRKGQLDALAPCFQHNCKDWV